MHVNVAPRFLDTVAQADETVVEGDYPNHQHGYDDEDDVSECHILEA